MEVSTKQLRLVLLGLKPCYGMKNYVNDEIPLALSARGIDRTYHFVNLSISNQAIICFGILFFQVSVSISIPDFKNSRSSMLHIALTAFCDGHNDNGPYLILHVLEIYG